MNLRTSGYEPDEVKIKKIKSFLSERAAFSRDDLYRVLRSRERDFPEGSSRDLAVFKFGCGGRI